MAIAAKPNKKPKKDSVNDAIAMDFISQGGSVPSKSKAHEEPLNISTKGRHTTKTDPDAQVHVSVKLLVSERNRVNAQRLKRNVRNKVSLERWIIEAVNEKLEREEKSKK